MFVPGSGASWNSFQVLRYFVVRIEFLNLKSIYFIRSKKYTLMRKPHNVFFFNLENFHIHIECVYFFSVREKRKSLIALVEKASQG